MHITKTITINSTLNSILNFFYGLFFIICKWLNPFYILLTPFAYIARLCHQVPILLNMKIRNNIEVKGRSKNPPEDIGRGELGN